MKIKLVDILLKKLGFININGKDYNGKQFKGVKNMWDWELTEEEKRRLGL